MHLFRHLEFSVRTPSAPVTKRRVIYNVVTCFLFATIIQGCDSPAERETITISGTVSYAERIALTPDAMVTVSLSDINRADVVSRLLADTTFSANGLQVPISFNLLVDPTHFDTSSTYALRAEIRSEDGQLLWTTDTVTHIKLSDPKDAVELHLRSAKAANTDPDLGGQTWYLHSLSASGEVLSPNPDKSYTVELSTDGSITGQADCNRFNGTYHLSGESFSTTQLISTRAACNDGGVSSRFIQLLNGAKSVVKADSVLTIESDNGIAATLSTSPRASIQSGLPMIPQKTGETFVYDCTSTPGDTLSVTVKTGPGELAVWLPSQFEKNYLVLGQTRAASGARYEGDGMVVWTKGDSAMVSVGDRQYSTCRYNHSKAVWEKARLAGVLYRGLGNEPFWRLDIVNGNEASLYEPTGLTATVKLSEPNVSDNRTTYNSTGADPALSIEVIEESCSDTMSGQEFESSISVNLGDRIFTGCGRWLR